MPRTKNPVSTQDMAAMARDAVRAEQRTSNGRAGPARRKKSDAMSRDGIALEGSGMAVPGPAAQPLGVATERSGDGSDSIVVGGASAALDGAAPALSGSARQNRGRAKPRDAALAQDTAPDDSESRTIPLNRHGIPDRRYKADAHRLHSNAARSRKRPGRPPGAAWLARLTEAYGPPHRWELLNVGFQSIGIRAKSGYLVKRYVVLRCLEHPNEPEVIAGRGEAQRYGGVTLPARREGRPSIERPEFRSRFLDAPAEPVRTSGAPQVLRIPRAPADLFVEEREPQQIGTP